MRLSQKLSRWITTILMFCMVVGGSLRHVSGGVSANGDRLIQDICTSRASTDQTQAQSRFNAPTLPSNHAGEHCHLCYVHSEQLFFPLSNALSEFVARSPIRLRGRDLEFFLVKATPWGRPHVRAPPTVGSITG